jgi:WD40 repeat protein
LSSEEEGELSQAGSIVGTPAYMAPEQARGDRIDARADLFSLGCVLYRMAAGKVPFTGAAVRGILGLVATDDPPPPPEGIPSELSRLIMQLLAKRPEDRPDSARAVAESIKAIEDKLFGPRITRRHWLIAVAGFAGAGTAGGLVWWLTGGSTDDRSGHPVHPGQVSLLLEDPDRRVVLTSGEGEARTVDLAKESTLELPPGDYDLRLPRQEEKRSLVPNRLTVKAGEKQQVTLRLVGEIRQQPEHTQTVWSVALSPVKGSLLALSASSDHTVAVQDAATDNRPIFLTGHRSPVRCVAFSADGRLAVSGSGAGSRKADCSLRVWHLKEARQIDRPVIHDSWITCVAVSPTEPLIGWGAKDGTASLWDRRLNKKRRDLIGHDTTGVNSIAFSADGKRVLTAGHDRLVLLWAAADGQQQRKLSGHEGAVRSVAFSPTDNHRAASASDDGTIRVWDLAGGRSVVLLKGHKGDVLAVAWTPDGKRLVSGGRDGTVRVWSVAEKSARYCLKGHTGAVFSVACATDGRRALSGGADRTVRLWELPGD